MPKTITVTLSIDPNDTSQLRASHNPTQQVKTGDSVVFNVQGSSEVFTVTFPEGSPFVSTVSSIKVGGTTLAAQSSPPESVALVDCKRYRFWADLEKSSTSSAPGSSLYDSEGTETGDIDVVPETGGSDTLAAAVEAPYIIEMVGEADSNEVLPPLSEPVVGEPEYEEVPAEPDGGARN